MRKIKEERMDYLIKGAYIGKPRIVPKIKYKSIKEITKKMYKRTLLDEIVYYGFYIWWNWLTDLRWRIPNFIQRAYYGVGFADTWAFDSYLPKIIYRGLIYLKKNKHGYPMTTPINKPIDYSYNEKRWDKIMNKMVYAFKLAKEIGEGTREHYLPKMNKKYKKEYKCLTKNEDKAMKEGMQLFITYFFSLWD